MNRFLMTSMTVIAAIAMSVGATDALADLTLVKALDFDVDGVLPSSDPDIDFASNTTPPVTEQQVYTVQDGLLEQRTLDSHMGSPGWADYASPADLHGNQFIPDQGIVMEARLRILEIEAVPEPSAPESLGYWGAFFGAHDGVHTYQVLFDQTGVLMRVDGPAGFEHVDFDTSGFHTYRMRTPPSSNRYDLFIDGQLVHTAFATMLGSYNGYSWGDGRSVPQNGASVDWDYVKVWKVIPEPSTAVLCLLGFGIAAMAGRRLGSRPPSLL